MNDESNQQLGERLRAMYREHVLMHSREPRNRRRPAQVNREALGFNPLCGDKLSVFINQQDDLLTDVAFDGVGCAISLASASMMTTALENTTETEARELIAAINTMFAEGTLPTDARLADLAALASVRAYPSRIKCATLPWQTAVCALDQTHQQTSTE